MIAGRRVVLAGQRRQAEVGQRDRGQPPVAELFGQGERLGVQLSSGVQVTGVVQNRPEVGQRAADQLAVPDPSRVGQVLLEAGSGQVLFGPVERDDTEVAQDQRGRRLAGRQVLPAGRDQAGKPAGVQLARTDNHPVTGRLSQQCRGP